MASKYRETIIIVAAETERMRIEAARHERSSLESDEIAKKRRDAFAKFRPVSK